MSGTLLHITASPRGAQSHSRRVGAALVDRLSAEKDNLRVIRRDLGTDLPPHPDAAFMNANLTPEAERQTGDHAALTYSEMLLGELAAADIVIIDTPMHNFTLPSVLKSWVDYVVRPGRSFGLSPQGKVPLLKNRPVRVAVACGGSFSGPYAQQDFLTPYLRYVFATIGITDLDVHLMERVTRNEESRLMAAQHAASWIATQAAELA
jgi:FMN-dependent NADH-azoreductase